MAEVVLTGVRKSFGPIEVLKGIDLTIDDGDFAVILGPSGCGKTTLLRSIAGLEGITSGSIRIGERVVDDVPAAEREIGMVFQTYALFPHLNVYKNIAFGMRMRGERKDRIAEKVNEAAVKLRLTDYLARLPRELSGGQRQRVAIGRALVREPQVFLFDEPLSNLDAKLRVTMRIEIKELHQRLKTTIVYVTHDQIEAMTMADKIVVMRDGRVEQIGAPLDLYDHPANVFVAGFIGSPSMNFIPGRIAANGGQTLFVSESGLKLPLPPGNVSDGQEATYGIRPEHIEIGAGGIPVSVVVVEPTGSETQVFARAGKDLIDAIVKQRIRPNPGDEIGFIIDPANVHLFDRKTGQRI
jgi:multiple sugar transport system ATP-binding protein